LFVGCSKNSVHEITSNQLKLITFGYTHKSMRHHIYSRFNLFKYLLFALQWIFGLGFIFFGCLGWWLISLISLAISFCFLILRKVNKHHAKESFIKWLKNLPDPMDILKKLGLNRSQRRKAKRDIEKKHTK
jgi:hypothetical protein